MRGKIVALSTSAAALVALAGSVYAAKDRIVEEWCLRNIENSDNETRDAAWDCLVKIGSHRCRPKFLDLLSGPSSEYLQARAFQALWMMDGERVDGPLDFLEGAPRMGSHLVQTKVKSVLAKEKLLVLSAGKDQDVRLWTLFTVLREGKFVGVVRITKVFPDLSGAEFVATRSGLEIQVGDTAIGIGQQLNESEKYMIIQSRLGNR